MLRTLVKSCVPALPRPHLRHPDSCALVVPAVHEIKAMSGLVVEVDIKKAKVKYRFCECRATPWVSEIQYTCNARDDLHDSKHFLSCSRLAPTAHRHKILSTHCLGHISLRSCCSRILVKIGTWRGVSREIESAEDTR